MKSIYGKVWNRNTEVGEDLDCILCMRKNDAGEYERSIYELRQAIAYSELIEFCFSKVPC